MLAIYGSNYLGRFTTAAPVTYFIPKIPAKGADINRLVP